MSSDKHTGSVLARPSLVSVLARLWHAAEATDRELLPRIHAEAARIGARAESSVRDLLVDAYLPVDAPTARLLYVLARARRPRLAVEFGTSFGISAIHLAAALIDDGGAGRLVSTELEPTKVARARDHLAEAGVDAVVEIRAGDARETLGQLDGPIDLVFLDGWKDLYLPVLRGLEPRLAPGAIIVADDLNILPQALVGYLAHVRAPDSGYVSVELPVGDGIEVSTWVGPPAP